jgi:hypothetical protein
MNRKKDKGGKRRNIAITVNTGHPEIPRNRKGIILPEKYGIIGKGTKRRKGALFLEYRFLKKARRIPQNQKDTRLTHQRGKKTAENPKRQITDRKNAATSPYSYFRETPETVAESIYRLTIFMS